MRGQFVKWGNSLAIRIPKAIVDKAKLRVGDQIEIEVADQGCIQLQRVCEPHIVRWRFRTHYAFL